MPAAAIAPVEAGRRASRPALRADIQALRAIAVALVVVYHLAPNRLSGGFVGVDIFFVISGYLITGHLLREFSHTGKIRLAHFWAGRARRILPASLITIAVTIVASALILPITDLDSATRQALAAIFYIQNWVLAAQSVDYLAADNSPTAFQHFWSLSVEEQFYLVWPVVAIVVIWSATRRGHLTSRRVTQLLFGAFGLITVVSFGYSWLVTSSGRPDAYFLTLARMWELGAGGLLACIPIRRLPAQLRSAITYLGFGLLVASVLILNGDSQFPGLAAVPVIVGTAAILAAGTPTSDQNTPVTASLEPWRHVSRLRWVQWLGDRSYSIYLWHYPLIVLWPYITGSPLRTGDKVAILAATVVLAAASYRWVEQPVRFHPRLLSRASTTGWASVTAMIAVACLVAILPTTAAVKEAEKNWDELATSVLSSSSFGAQAVSARQIPTYATDEAAIAPNPLDAHLDRNRAFDHETCVAEARDDDTPTCTVGPNDASISIALVGDSHARMYSTALAHVATQNSWRLQTYLHNACPFNPHPIRREVKQTAVCTTPNEKVIAQLLEDPPDLVITAWYNGATFVSGPDSTAANPTRGAQGFAQYWDALETAGTEVLVIRDVPRVDESAPTCVADNYEQADRCTTPRSRALRPDRVLNEAISLVPEVTVLDLSDLYCDSKNCHCVIGGVLVYKDQHHITDTFANTLTPWLEQGIEAALSARSNQIVTPFESSRT